MNTEVYEATLKLRAIREFRPDPVADEVVAAILEAGRWTGSSKNTQPWAFIVVTDAARRAEVASAGRFTDPVRAAPLVIVVVRTPGGGDYDMGRVAHNMMLAAAALGVGSCPVTLHDEERARRILAVPDDHGCRWTIAAGYPQHGLWPGRRTGLPSGRVPMSSLRHDDQFDRHR